MTSSALSPEQSLFQLTAPFRTRITLQKKVIQKHQGYNPYFAGKGRCREIVVGLFLVMDGDSSLDLLHQMGGQCGPYG